jgi:hypothetical protein
MSLVKTSNELQCIELKWCGHGVVEIGVATSAVGRFGLIEERMRLYDL